ncbi:Sugar phosphate isomerase/epimerase OS=Castellaniella defragrans OX=75697 GN=HNR28_003404 PE=4 SV=1 [Castellaniella defragrans]
MSGDDPDERVVMDLFVQACELAAPLGLKVDLEFMPWSGINSLAKAAQVVTAAGQANGAVLVDTLHLSRSGGTPADIAAFDPGLFGYVQVCDAPPVPPSSLDEIAHEARVARLIPGEGGLPLADVLAALPDGLPVSLELPMKDLARKMPALERARLAMAGVRRVLDSVRSSV